MTTNGEEGVHVANGDVSGDIEGSVPEVSCDRCRELTEELQKRKKEHTIYTALKKKISLTDSLIKKYNSKCQEFDQQQQKLQDVTLKLASTKGDCKVLEEQLTVTLKEIIPWKCDKNKFLKEYEDCKKRLSETVDKLNGSEALCVQFESKLAETEDYRKTLEKCKQMEKKAAAFKEDLVKCRKELKATKNRESSLATHHEKAKNKISELVQILRDHGFSVPKIPKVLRGGTADYREGTSNEDTDFEAVDEVFSRPQDVSSPPKQESSPPEEAEQQEERRKPHPQEDACHEIFERFSTSEMNCMSPLPPSPKPAFQDEVLSDLSSNMTEDDARDDDAFSDFADEINNLMEVNCHREESQEGSQETQDEGRSQAAEEPRQASLERPELLSQVYDDLCDDSEEETSEKLNHDKVFHTMPKKESLNEAKPASEELLTDVWNNELKDQRSTSSQDDKDCDLEEVEIAKQRKHSGRKLIEVDKSGNTSSLNVSGKSSKNKNHDTEVFTLGSSLSEESDDEEDDKANSGKKLSGNPERESLLAGNLKTSAVIQRNFLSPVQSDLDKHGNAAVDAQKKLLLSPDQRMTRSQLKMLASLGDVELTGSSDSTFLSDNTREKSHLEKISPPAQGDSSVLQDRKAPESDEIKLSAQDPEKLSESHPHPPCRRPTTRSLSHSETESLSETVPPSPAKSLKKRALRFGSVSDTDLSPQNPVIASDAIKTEPELSAFPNASSPSRHSPRKLLRSVSLTDDASMSKTVKKERGEEDSLLPKTFPQVSLKDSPKPFLRSSSVPGDTSSGKQAEVIPRRITRSQKHCLESPPRERMILKRLTRSSMKRLALKTKSEKSEILSQIDTSCLRANSETPSTKETKVAKSIFAIQEPVVSDDFTHLKSKSTCGNVDSKSDNSREESVQTPSKRRTRAALCNFNSDDKSTEIQEGPCSSPEIDRGGESLRNKSMLKVAGTEVIHVESDSKPETIDSLKVPGRSTWKASRKIQELSDDRANSGDESLFDSCSGTGDKKTKQDLQGDSHMDQPLVAESFIESVDPLECNVGNEVVHSEVSSDDSDLPCVNIFATPKKTPQGEGDYCEDFERRDKGVHNDFIQEINPTCSKETNPGILNPELKPSSTKRTILDGEESVLKKLKLSFHATRNDQLDSRCSGTMTSESTSEGDALTENTLNVECEDSGDKAVPVRSKLYQTGEGCQVAEDCTEGQQQMQSIGEGAEPGLSEDAAAKSKVQITKTNKGRTSCQPTANASGEELAVEEDDSTDARPEHTLQGGNRVLKGEDIEREDKVTEDVETNQVVHQRVFDLQAVVRTEDGTTASIKQNTKENSKEENKSSLAVSELTSSGAKSNSNSGGEDADLDNEQQHTAYKNEKESSRSDTLEGSVIIEEESDISFDDVEQDVAHQARGRQEDPGDTLDKASSNCSFKRRAACQLESLLLDLSSSEEVEIHCNSSASQVVCVEAESSRASTPTTDVLSINSMSGHVSPVSPLSFQELDRTSPLSPLASGPHSPLVSPLSPFPNIFDSLANFPRILSPLPPSPGTPELESDGDAVEPSAPRGVVLADVINQPRMISPLFPTPVPPVVSPLLDPPIPHVLSPLSDTSPQRLGDFVFRDRSPMISPLRNPLIPSPCNFHAEAPRDALSVRPQHLPAPKRQPASRCLTASFTIATSPPGMNQAPEIISPRLHSLASELVFEFGESQPSTSGFQRQRLTNVAPIVSQEANAEDKVDHGENSKESEEQKPTFVKRGFKKICAKPESAKNETAVEELPTTSNKVDLSGQNDSDGQNLHDETQKKSLGNNLKMLITPKSPEKKHSGPQKTRSRIKSCDEAIEEKSHGRCKRKKSKTSSESSEDAECKVPRRFTRSQSGSGADASTASNVSGSSISTPSSLRKCDEVEKNSEAILKSSTRRKNSINRSGESEVIEKTVDPKVDGCRDASCKTTSGEVASSEDGSFSQPVGANVPSALSLLIPAVEVKKVSGFKKSGSLQRVRDSKQEPEALGKAGDSDNQTDATLEKEKATQEDQGNNESKLPSREPKAFENSSSLGDSSIEKNLGENKSFCQNQFQEDVAPASSVGTNSYKVSPQVKCSSNKIPNQVLSPTLIAGGSQQIAPTNFRTMFQIEDQQTTRPKSIQVKSNIGNVWGNIASRKEPRYDIFNRGKKNKVRVTKVGHGDHSMHSMQLGSPLKTDTGGSSSPMQNGNQEAMRGKSQSQLDVRKNNSNAFSGAGSSFSPRSPPPYQRMETQPSQRPWSGEAAKTHISDTQTLDAGTCAQSTNPPKTLVPSEAEDLRSGSDKEKADPVYDLNNIANVRATVSKQSELGSASLSHGMQSGPGGVQGWTMGAAGESQMQTNDSLEPTRPKGDLKGKKRPVVGNSGWDIDEQPSPKLPKIMTPGQPLTPSRSGATQSESDGKHALDYDLETLIHRIIELQSDSDVTPVIDAVMNFLGNRAVSLMPSILAKCRSGNTSLKAMLLPHEKDLLTCIMESVFSTTKSNMGMLMTCLSRGVQREEFNNSTEPNPRVVVGAAYCRMLAALARKTGAIGRIRVLCYDIVREDIPDAAELLLNVAVTWSTVLKRKEGAKALPLCSALEVIIMQRLANAALAQDQHAQQMMNCFQSVSGWNAPSGTLVAESCSKLFASLQDVNTTKFYTSEKSEPRLANLTSKSYELVKTVELFAHHLGWEWTNDYLIREKLWPVLKNWSQGLQQATSPAGTGQDRLKPDGTGVGVETPADASACAVMKIIGNVASLGLASNRQSVYEILKMLAGVLQQPTESVPLTVQFCTAEAILSLSPSNPTFALAVLQQWKLNRLDTLPTRIEDKMCVLTKIACAASGVTS